MEINEFSGYQYRSEPLIILKEINPQNDHNNYKLGTTICV